MCGGGGGGAHAGAGGGGAGGGHTVTQLVEALRHMPESTQSLTKTCTTNISFGKKVAGE